MFSPNRKSLKENKSEQRKFIASETGKRNHTPTFPRHVKEIRGAEKRKCVLHTGFSVNSRKAGNLATKPKKNVKKLPSTLDILPSTLDNIPSTLDPRQKTTLVLFQSVLYALLKLFTINGV